MANLSYLTTKAKEDQGLTFNIPTDESVGAILIDISGFDPPLANYPLLYHNFKDGQVQRVRNMDDATLLGIRNDSFLNGLLYYHLKQFYDYVGDVQALYIAIADCSESWDVLQYMQQQVSGRIFQVGVWTSQPIWQLKEDGTYGFTPLITNLQKQADEINGKVGTQTSKTTPLNIVLFGNSNYIDGIMPDWRKLPNAFELECPKVSVVLAQNGTDDVHKMQDSLPNKAPVSAMGIVMACLALCGAEESIASVSSCDLNKNEGFNKPEWGFGRNHTPIVSVHKVWDNLISSKGYIFPIDYEGLEASYFLSSDQTLSSGDFCSIANNRVMHKCRRAISTALVPYINSNHIYVPGSRTISHTSVSIITDSIITTLSSVMKNKKGSDQIDGRRIVFLENDNMLNDDSISIKIDIKPVNYSSYISEEVSHDPV